MNAPATAHLMSGDDYRESLRRYKPTVFVDGRRVDSVADEPGLPARHQCHRAHLRLRAASPSTRR